MRKHADAAAQVSFTGGQTRDVGGTVRITASQIAATFLLPPLLAALHAAHPALQLEVIASDQTDNLLRREADLAVRMYRPTQNDLISKKVAQMPIGIYAAHRYVAQHGLPDGLADLGAHKVIGYDRNTLILDGMQQMGMTVDRSFFAFRSDDQVVCWRMVQAGFGIGFAPRQIGDADPNLIQIWPELDICSIPVWLTAHPELRIPPRVRLCFDHLVQQFSAFDRTPN